jgi:hypothetical protein
MSILLYPTRSKQLRLRLADSARPPMPAKALHP